MSEKHSLAKAAGIVGSGTLLSRILGFTRDIVIARLFGTSIFAQAFVVAFRIPNLLRDLVGEGATNAAFVPVLTEYLTKKPRDQFWELARTVLNILFLVLLFLSALGVIFSPSIVKVIAPGFIKDPTKFALTVKLTRVLFPYLIFIGLTAYVIGILNSFKHFTAPAFSQGTLNVCVILSALFLCPVMEEPVMGLGIGVLLGGMAQLSINVPVLFRKGFRLGREINFAHPAAKKIGRLLLPRALGACVYQVNVFVDTMLASLAFIVGEGAVAALYYSNRIIQFPLAIFGIAMATAALPTMSIHAAKDNIADLKKTLSFALRNVFFITIPSAVGLWILSVPITRILFQRGQFDQYSTSITSTALFFYCFGLFAYAGIKILVSCFYSMQNTLTPVKVASLCVALNFILNIILMWPLKVGGLALATSISATCNFCLLLIILRRKLGPLGGRQILFSAMKMLLAGLLMGTACFALYKEWFIFAQGPFQEIFRLGIIILMSVVLYFFIALFLGLDQPRKILQSIRRNK